MANLLAWLARPDEPLPRIQKLAELKSDSREYHNSLSFDHFSRSDLTSCVRDLQRAGELTSDARSTLLQRALYHTMAGEREQAIALMQHLEASPKPDSFTTIAWVYAHMGDLDACFRWLETGFKPRQLQIGSFRVFLGVAHVRADPRFGDPLKKMNLD